MTNKKRDPLWISIMAGLGSINRTALEIMDEPEDVQTDEEIEAENLKNKTNDALDDKYYKPSESGEAFDPLRDVDVTMSGRAGLYVIKVPFGTEDDVVGKINRQVALDNLTHKITGVYSPTAIAEYIRSGKKGVSKRKLYSQHVFLQIEKLDEEVRALIAATVGDENPFLGSMGEVGGTPKPLSRNEVEAFMEKVKEATGTSPYEEDLNMDFLPGDEVTITGGTFQAFEAVFGDYTGIGAEGDEMATVELIDAGNLTSESRVSIPVKFLPGAGEVKSSLSNELVRVAEDKIGSKLGELKKFLDELNKSALKHMGEVEGKYAAGRVEDMRADIAQTLAIDKNEDGKEDWSLVDESEYLGRIDGLISKIKGMTESFEKAEVSQQYKDLYGIDEEDFQGASDVADASKTVEVVEPPKSIPLAPTVYDSTTYTPSTDTGVTLPPTTPEQQAKYDAAKARAEEEQRIMREQIQKKRDQDANRKKKGTPPAGQVTDDLPEADPAAKKVREKERKKENKRLRKEEALAAKEKARQELEEKKRIEEQKKLQKNLRTKGD